MIKLLLSVDIATKFIPVCIEYEIQCHQEIDYKTILEYI